MTTLETDRLVLRPYEPQDEAAYFRLVQDPAVMRYLPGGATLDEAAARAAFQRRLSGADPQRHHFAIILRETGDLVGWVGLMPLEKSGETEIYFGLRPDAWGHGYATEAAKRVARWAFEEIGLSRIVAVADPENPRGAAVLARLGASARGVETHYGRPLATYLLAASGGAPEPPAPFAVPPPSSVPASAPVASRGFCGACGAALSADAAFCGQCGRPAAVAVAAAPAWAISPPPPAEAGAHARPGAITYACILSVVLGVLGCLSALVVLSVSGSRDASYFPPWMLPSHALAGFVLAGMGVLGILAGLQGLQGAAWARPAMIVLFALGALIGIMTLIVPALNILAIIALAGSGAGAWFREPPRRQAW